MYLRLFFYNIGMKYLFILFNGANQLIGIILTIIRAEKPHLQAFFSQPKNALINMLGVFNWTVVFLLK